MLLRITIALVLITILAIIYFYSEYRTLKKKEERNDSIEV